MGKADMTRDYYSDLEVSPTADIIEIKKQFKKLALKWHPDRNPGRETEVNAKFQTIQSAHEILTDEAERRRYDAGRNRSGNRFFTTTGGTSGGTRGNPYSTAGAQWAPPPKPYGTPRANAAGQGASGARKYEKFKPETSSRTTPRQTDPETKKANYEAFERMRKNHPTGTFARGGWQAPGSPKVPDPKYTPQSGREESNNQKHPPPPKPSKPGYDEWINDGMHGRQSPKKAGFMPGNPGGDEPPAPRASSGYYNVRSPRPSTANASKAPEPPPRPRAFEKFQDEVNQPMDGTTRQSTPYATHGGEKTNPFESNIHRSKTTRERPTANGYSTASEARGADSSSTGNKQRRSASPPRSRRFQNPSPPFGTNVASPPKRNHANINKSPPTPGTSGKAGGASRSNARFKARAESDTSSEDEDSDVQSTPENEPSNKKLPRRGGPAQNGADNASTSNVREETQRKANLAEFRTMFHSGDPLLNKLCSESTGNQKATDPASQPMYAKGSHRPPFYNYFSKSPFAFHSQSFQAASEDQSLPEGLKSQAAQDRSINRKQSRFFPTSRSPPKAEKQTSSPDSGQTSKTTEGIPRPTSPLSRADDLSDFEQSMMGGLYSTFVKNRAPNAPSSKFAAQNRGLDGHAKVVFGQPTQIFGQPTQIFGQPTQIRAERPEMFPFDKHQKNLANQTASSTLRSPKRKVGGLDSNVGSPTRVSRKKTASVYDGFQDSASNKTNGTNNRFPSAYRSQPSSNPPLFTNNAGSINTKFETGKWDGQFRATSFVNPTEFNNGPSRPRAGSRSGRRSPTKSRPAGRTRSASASVHSESAEQTQATNQSMESPTKPFTPEEWSGPEMFRPSTFAPPTPQGPTKPPFSSRTPSRKGSRARAPRTAGARPAVVEDYLSDSEVEFEQPSSGVNGGIYSTNPQTGAPSPNAMDIDPPYNNEGDQPRQPGEARNVPVEPLRPEWRAGATNGDSQTSNIASGTSAGTSKHKAEEGSKINFDDFRKLEPLFHPAQGLNSTDDLKDSLPFQSTASNTIPINSETTSRPELRVPNPPCAPRVPSQMDGTQRMSASSWQSYLVAFQAYLADYHAYNQKMETHFSARQAQFAQLIHESGWAWLNSKSDKILEEQVGNCSDDKRIRDKWAEAGRGHVHAMQEFQSVRAALSGQTEEG